MEASDRDRGACCAAQGLEAALERELPTGRSTAEQYSGRGVGVVQRGAAMDYGHRGLDDRLPAAAFPSHQHGSNFTY